LLCYIRLVGHRILNRILYYVYACTRSARTWYMLMRLYGCRWLARCSRELPQLRPLRGPCSPRRPLALRAQPHTLHRDRLYERRELMKERRCSGRNPHVVRLRACFSLRHCVQRPRPIYCKAETRKVLQKTYFAGPGVTSGTARVLHHPNHLWY
jgi:hypothetical protein